MMERVEVTATVPEGETSVEVFTGYVSGLVEGIYMWSDTQAGMPQLNVSAVEPTGGTRLILLLPTFGGGAVEYYPRTVIVTIGGDPVEYATGFPVVEKVPVYGIISVSLQEVQAGETFNIAIYLSNSNPNGR